MDHLRGVPDHTAYDDCPYGQPGYGCHCYQIALDAAEAYADLHGIFGGELWCAAWMVAADARMNDWMNEAGGGKQTGLYCPPCASGCE